VAWRIEWTPAAAIEAEAEAAKYALKREGLGDRFLDEIDATIERITEGPEHFQRWPDDPSYRRAVVHVFPFVVCFQCCEALLVPSGAYHYRYEAENLSAQLQISDDGAPIAVSRFGLPSQALPARELLPALYACGVRYIELLERLDACGRPSYDLPLLHEAAAAARDLLVRRGWL
jgi:hypothetical protein